MINTRFIWYLEKSGILDRSQCGFRKHRCTTDHLGPIPRTIPSLWSGITSDPGSLDPPGQNRFHERRIGLGQAISRIDLIALAVSQKCVPFESFVARESRFLLMCGALTLPNLGIGLGLDSNFRVFHDADDFVIVSASRPLGRDR